MSFLQKLIDHQNLNLQETEEIMNKIMNGELSDIQIAGILIALQSKCPTIEEITGCAKMMRQYSIKINPRVQPLVDTCGTGGDKIGTFNISTTVAFVIAGAGCFVAKHGNKAASSLCGSADVLQALGIKIDLAPEQVQKCLEEVGIGFMFAPLFHPAMKYVMPARKELGVRTVFNILGPLTNPANALHQVIGVFNPELTELMAEVLKNLGSRHALIVHGKGLDELTVTGQTKITELKNNQINTFEFNPQDYGLAKSSLKNLYGGDARKNAEITLNILKGIEKSSKRDVVLLNSAAALIAADKADNFAEGIKMAEESINSGQALQKLENLKTFSNRL